MKYYLDTEFHEYHKQPKVCGIKIGKAIPTIDLISIGIVSEDLDKPAYGGGKLIEVSYYAISKDFNIKDAWNSFQWKNEWVERDPEFKHTIKVKEYWLRENVLKPICKELAEKDGIFAYGEDAYFTLKRCKYLINKYGKSNKQIAKEINEFVGYSNDEDLSPVEFNHPKFKHEDVQFYAYYADYDWVVFCWLFGRMIDLPTGFPMYCNDLKQLMDEKVNKLTNKTLDNICNAGLRNHPKEIFIENLELDYKLQYLKSYHPDYPKQNNEHNALDDAKWDKELYKFINDL